MLPVMVPVVVVVVVAARVVQVERVVVVAGRPLD